MLERSARRELRHLDSRGERRRVLPARGVDFASNDYLGLRCDPRVITAAHAALDEYGFGAGAARLLRGDHPIYRQLEERFAALQRSEDALLFPSGFHANYGLLAALGSEGWTIVSDAHNHASIIDGCHAARARTVVVPHGDLAAFAAAVQDARTLIITESVFSMNGDRAPIRALSKLRAALIVDEAHAIGLFEPEGDAALRVNPCGKALAGAGAVVTGSHAVIDLLRSRCRTFLFTTALPPSIAAGVLAALDIAVHEPELAARALSLARRIKPNAVSCIVPIPCRDNEHALRSQARLQEQGLDVRAVRPPTVPQALLRLSFHADRTDAEIERLGDALAALELAP